MAGETKAALLDAAEAATRTRGVAGFSYGDLSQEVGIRTASIHYHFPTKAGLTEALLARYHDRMADQCAAIAGQEPQAAGRLRRLIALYRAALSGGDQVCLCVALTLNRESLSPAVQARIVAFRAMMRDWIAGVLVLGDGDGTLRPAARPEVEAEAILATLEGAHLAARAEADTGAFDRAVALLRGRCG